MERSLVNQVATTQQLPTVSADLLRRRRNRLRYDEMAPGPPRRPRRRHRVRYDEMSPTAV